MACPSRFSFVISRLLHQTKGRHVLQKLEYCDASAYIFAVMAIGLVALKVTAQSAGFSHCRQSIATKAPCGASSPTRRLAGQDNTAATRLASADATGFVGSQW
jgi:hypothetical protein